MTWLDHSLDYQRLAEQHRPTDASTLTAEVSRLVATGLSPRDVATALRLDLVAVLEMLREAA